MSVKPAGVPATHWPEAVLVRDVDGDTALLALRRVLDVAEDWTLEQRTTSPKGTRCRLVWVNTPDLPDLAGKAKGTADTIRWFADQLAAGHQLAADSYGRDEFSRLLVDVYPAGQPDLSLSRWLMLHGNDGAGWPAYGPKG